MQVVALLHGEPGVWGISFPDFPGVASGGATVEDAVERARDGLYSLVEDWIDEGRAIPEPRSLEAIRAAPDCAEDLLDCQAVILVDVDLPTRAIRLNITLDEGLVARIDRAAKASGETRSGFLAQAARARLSGA
ncbi:MAG: type II toxin-antitoxin system HicB family antitoxin [Asticcacaulis sp.]